MDGELFTGLFDLAQHIEERLHVALRALQETPQRPGVEAARFQVADAIKELHQLMDVVDPDEHPAR